MKDFDQKKAAKEFAERWKDKGYEKGESQKYWIDLLSTVLGVDDPISFIEFEDTVHIDQATGFIDGYIPSTKILIEQKSIDKDLRKPIKQSDGSLLNPFQQAKRYAPEMGHDRYPRYVITCNFKSFLVYDMNNPNGEPEEILLKDLGKEYYRLSFIVDSKNEHLKKEEELSFKAGDLVGKIYDAFSKQYNDISNETSQKSLNELCVRLVFCLYAEDAGLFGRKNVFHDYLSKFEDLDQMRKALIDLFKILDTKIEDRDPYLEDDLNQFPYVNGGLFSNENIEIPRFTEEIKDILLAKASDDFDWSEISPTIFGAVFESTLNPETRRSGGMHYTSIENIHKVIDPLFLNELREKLNDALAYKNEKIRNDKLIEFQNYIASLTFFDPACGSGNFLTETYLSLRRLENEALDAMGHGMMTMNLDGSSSTIKVSIQQFYGIEINDFAVKVAKTALWIAEAQMYFETKKIVVGLGEIEDFLPLETYENIVEGNALRLDWNDVIPADKLNYIMGNPPFVGASMCTESQKEEIIDIVGKIKLSNSLDYVTGWYYKAAQMINISPNIKCAFVSTNSITQGEQVAPIWDQLLHRYNISIDFAYRTFRWDSEASLKAHVHCVIIGFSFSDNKTEKKIFEGANWKSVENINPYLLNAPSILITSRSKPICEVPKLTKGNQPTDDGNFILTKEQKENLILQDPSAAAYIHRYVGAKDYLNNNEERYCIWLKDVPASVYRGNREVMRRLGNIKEFRSKSTAAPTRKSAEWPYRFFSTPQTNETYLIIPRVSSERRRYIPIGFMNPEVIAADSCSIVCGAGLFEFGILESNVHMAWMRVVCGRLKSDYRYSGAIVYNNFPWPNPTKEQKEKIEKTAKMILDARAKYPNSSLADLYDELTMPSDLRRAHQLNDVAVMEAYGFNWKKMTESDCVAELMKMYLELVK